MTDPIDSEVSDALGFLSGAGLYAYIELGHAVADEIMRRTGGHIITQGVVTFEIARDRNPVLAMMEGCSRLTLEKPGHARWLRRRADRSDSGHSAHRQKT